MQADEVVAKMLEELKRANRIHGNFTSPHHGYAVILEELDELWDEVKQKHPDKERMLEEAIQIGAMAVKFIVAMESSWKPKDYTVSAVDKAVDNL